MAVAVPSIEPTVIIAGDTIPWTKSLSDFPSTDWVLTYAFRLQKGSGKVDVTGTPQPDASFSMVIEATVTAKMVPGDWVWASYVTKATERYQIGTGVLMVQPNLATINEQTDLRSPAKRALDNALVAWESVKLGQTVMLNGRTYTQHNLTSLIVYVDRCRADYQSELDKQKLEQTGINPRHIGVRFGRP
jgi:hypothetical protein